MISQYELMHLKVGDIVSCGVNTRADRSVGFISKIEKVNHYHRVGPLSLLFTVQFFDGGISYLGDNVRQHWNKE